MKNQQNIKNVFDSMKNEYYLNRCFSTWYNFGKFKRVLGHRHVGPSSSQ